MNENLFAVEHLALACRSTTLLKDWYCSVLGATVVHQMNQEPPAYLINLGGLLLELYTAGESSDLTKNNRLAGWRHLALKVHSLDHARTLLESKGVHFPDPVKPAGGGGRVLFFSDPEGNLLHLVERLPQGFQG